MPLTLTSFDEHPLCFGFTWEVRDAKKLADLVARLLLGHYRHVARIINSIPGRVPTTTAHAIDAAVAALGTPASDDLRWQRDGWVFQMISWIAAHHAMTGNVASSIPHPRPSNKGFDGLLIELSPSADALAGVVICEDKATGSPRSTIRNQVWPEFCRCESGERDAELQSEITSVLERHGVPNLDNLLEAIYWKGKLAYRVSVTAPANRKRSSRRKALFRGYDSAVGGAHTRRRAEVLQLDDLRNWMDEFCDLTTSRLEAMRS